MTPTTPDFTQQRAGFIGRVQEQRQFLVAINGLLAHHRRWVELAHDLGDAFSFALVAGDNSYANIFLPHGIGGIGKSWLTRRCLSLAEGIPAEPPLLTLYEDVSLGSPVLEPIHLLDRLHDQLAGAGYRDLLAEYRQAKADLPPLVERVTRYQFENREQWNKLVKIAADLVSRRPAETPYHSYAEISLAYSHASGAETAGRDAPTLNQAYALLLEQMQQARLLTPAEAALFRHPPATLAALLVTTLNRITLRQPLVIGLDNLEIIVPLEPLIRDTLLLPTHQSPIIWLLSGRYNLADERVVELAGGSQAFKGYRDLLGMNPPVVWDMSIFGDADLHDYLVAEADRRRVSLLIDDELIEAIKTTSSGVPLVVEMVTDALFAMSREQFLREFALDDRSLLPGDRLAVIAERFLRYCLTQPQDLERVQAMALLRKGADEAALAAVWRLPAEQPAARALLELRSRYAFVLPEGLHDAVYDFVRRQLRSGLQFAALRERLSRRAVDFFQTRWDGLHQSLPDSTRRVRDPRWQTTTRDLLNALLWLDPDQAVLFLLPRFVEGLGFDRAFSNGLLLQAEEFLADSAAAFSHSHTNLLRRMRVGLQDIDWTFDEPGEAIGAMLTSLLDAPGLSPLHLGILHLWHGNWLVENSQLEAGLTAYFHAEQHIPADSPGLRQQLGKAFYEISGRYLWPESAAETVPSESALIAAERAVALDAANSGAWFNYGIALDHAGRPEQALAAFSGALKLDPRPRTYNHVGEVYHQLQQDEQAMVAYRQAIDLDAAYAWPYHNLGLIHAEHEQYEPALAYYQQALEYHQRDKDRAVTWDNFGDAHALLGHHEEAISAYRWAGVLDAHADSPWYGLGNVYTTLERYREAIDAYQQAITLNPANAWAYHRLGLVYARRGEAAMAIPYYNQAIERHEDDADRAITWNDLGRLYAQLDRRHDASEAYRQAIKLDPAQAAAWNNLGDIFTELDNAAAALDAYRQAVRLEPDFAAPWDSLGNIYAARRQYPEAIAAFQRVIKLEPDYAWPYHNLGFIYRRQNDYKRAATWFEQAVARHDDAAAKAVSSGNLADVLVLLGRPAAAIAAYHAAIELDPAYAWPYHNLAQLHRKRGDDEAAVPLYRQAIERHPRDEDRALSWFNLAEVYQRLNQPAEAAAAYRQVTTLNPTDAEAFNNLGDCYRALAQHEPAIAAYKQAVALEPDYALPYHSLGEVFSLTGDHRIAARYFQQAIEHHADDPSRAVSWNALGEALLALDESAAAAPAFAQAVKLDPRYHRPYHGLGQIAEAGGDPAAALEYYRQAARRYPPGEAWFLPQARLWNGLGNVYRTLNRFDEAVAAYRRAAKFDPELAPPWDSLGDIFRQQGQAESAAQAYERAIELDSKPANPYMGLGLLSEARGDDESARRRYQQALRRYPTAAGTERAVAWNHVGNVSRNLAQSEAAINAYHKAISLREDYFEPWHSLGDLFRQLAQDRPALEAYRRAAALDPTAASPWSRMGEIYFDLGEDTAAIESFERAMALDPAPPQPYHRLGRIYELQELYPEAVGYYEQAISRYGQSDRPAQAAAWAGLGNIYFARNEQKQAIAAYRQATTLDGALASPYHRLGLIYSRQGQPESAIIFYRQALERYPVDEPLPTRAEAWNDLGDACCAVQRWEDAVAAYQQAIDLDKRFALPWYNLGNIYSRREESYPDAVNAYDRAIELDPTHGWAYNNLAMVLDRQGRPQDAIDLYRQAIKFHPHRRDQATSWDNLGDVYQARRQYEEAVNAYRQAIDLNPQYARPWKSLGDVYRAQHRPEGVMEAYQQAIALEPGYAWPYHSLGLIYKNKGAFPQAITYYQQAIDRHPQDTDRAVSWNGLGNVYLEMGRYNDAADAYRQAIQLNPADAWPYHNLGFVSKQQGVYPQAIGLYLQAIERFEGDRYKAISWNNLGNVYSVLGRNQDAVEAYQQAIALNKNYALPWNSLGETFARLERLAEAAAAYQEAIRLNPHYVLAYHNLGDAHWQLTRYDEAGAAYRQAIALDEQYVWPYHNLALLYDERGEYEQALKYYNLAIERHPSAEQKAVLADKMGDLYRINDQPQRAIDAYRRAAGFDPGYASPWYNLGNIQAGLEQDDEAIAAYRKAIALKPGDPWPYHNLALVYEKREVYGEAIALYQQAIERQRTDRDRAISWENLGNVYNDLNRLAEAVSAFQEAIRLNPEYALPWSSLGDVFTTLEQFPYAEGAYRQAIALDPAYVWAYNSLGAVYESMGRPELAVRVYREAIARHGDHRDLAVSWNSLGDIFSASNHDDEAIAAYEQAIRIDPDYTWPYNRLGAIYERRGDRDQAIALYSQATRRHRQRTESSA
jgi:superkiller protein 3